MKHTLIIICLLLIGVSTQAQKQGMKEIQLFGPNAKIMVGSKEMQRPKTKFFHGKRGEAIQQLEDSTLEGFYQDKQGKRHHITNRERKRRLFGKKIVQEDSIIVDSSFRQPFDENVPGQVGASNTDPIPTAALTAGRKSFGIYVEMDNWSLKNSFSNNPTLALNYITGLFNVVASRYAIADIDLFISGIKIHDRPMWADSLPINGMSSLTYLQAFQARTRTFPGNLASFITLKPSNLGGLAFYGGLLNKSVGYNIQNLYLSYSTTTYSWSVNCWAHEIAHNLDGQHTFTCVWPFPDKTIRSIDSCANNDGCNTKIVPVKGTILSYCHTQWLGIDWNLNWNQKVICQLQKTAWKSSNPGTYLGVPDLYCDSLYKRGTSVRLELNVPANSLASSYALFENRRRIDTGAIGTTAFQKVLTLQRPRSSYDYKMVIYGVGQRHLSDTFTVRTGLAVVPVNISPQPKLSTFVPGMTSPTGDVQFNVEVPPNSGATNVRVRGGILVNNQDRILFDSIASKAGYIKTLRFKNPLKTTAQTFYAQVFAWNQTNNFTGGILAVNIPATTVAPPPTCTSFVYSAWGPWQNGVRTRTVVSASPTGCTGGNPVLSETQTTITRTVSVEGMPFIDSDTSKRNPWNAVDGKTSTRFVSSGPTTVTWTYASPVRLTSINLQSGFNGGSFNQTLLLSVDGITIPLNFTPMGNFTGTFNATGRVFKAVTTGTGGNSRILEISIQ